MPRRIVIALTVAALCTALGGSSGVGQSIPGDESFGDSLCGPGTSDRQDMTVINETDDVTFPPIPEAVSLTSGIAVNAHAEMFQVQVVLSDGSVDVEPEAMCLDLVPDTFHEKSPDSEVVEYGVDLNGDGLPDPPDMDFNDDGQVDLDDIDFDKDGEPGPFEPPAVLPGPRRINSFGVTERFVLFRPMGYFGTPFDPDSDRDAQAEIAAEAAGSLVGTAVGDWDDERREFSIDPWLEQLEDNSDFPGFTPLSTDSIPDGLPEGTDYRIDYDFDPTIGPTSSDGWQDCGFDAWAAVVVVPGGRVRAGLYRNGRLVDNHIVYTWNGNSYRCYVIRIQGIATSSTYAVFGQGWYWIY
jgi:hypothetical protein